MKVQFLGTSASPSMPVPFCCCQVCMNARRYGGKNLRKRSSMVVNDDLMIDIGPDIAVSSSELHIDLSKVSVCLQTHFHGDHFDPEMIISRHSDYGTKTVNYLLIAGSAPTLEMMDVLMGQRCGYGSIFDSQAQLDYRIKLMQVEPFERYSMGNYSVTGYPANHERGSLLYKVEDDNHCMFYGTDTSNLSDVVWNALIREKAKFDLVVLDHTYGIGYPSKERDHLASKDFSEHVQRFIRSGLMKNNGEIYATHISHEGIYEHSKLEEFAIENNYHIAYDGLVIEMG